VKRVMLFPFILALPVFLGGCYSKQDFRKKSSMELCMDYMTFPSYNIHQGTRAAVLSERGEDCSRYTGAAAAQNRANQQLEQTLRYMQQQR